MNEGGERRRATLKSIELFQRVYCVIVLHVVSCCHGRSARLGLLEAGLGEVAVEGGAGEPRELRVDPLACGGITLRNKYSAHAAV